MEKDLKAQNSMSLTAMYVGTFLLLGLVHWGVEDVFAISRILAEQVLIIGVITVFGGLLSNILPNNIKHMLVYWRLKNVLSGHRCRKLCTKDPRLNSNDLEKKWPILFLHEMEESEQNSYWYTGIYFPMKNKPQVVQAHRSFLLYRDVAVGQYLLLLNLLLWMLVGEVASVPSLSIWTALVLAGMCVLLSLAAQQSGDRMVVNAVVMALGPMENRNPSEQQTQNPVL